MLSHERCCELTEREIERFAAVLGDCPTDAPVAACPGWTAHDLALHLGSVHRWATALVALLSPGYLDRASLGIVEQVPTPAWMRDGGAALLAALHAADPQAPMWAWGADQHVRFWSRRQLHETMVHRFDLEAAAGAASVLDPELAADGVDEHLENLGHAERFSPNVAELRGSGEWLRLVAGDVGRSWLVRLEPDRFVIERQSADDPQRAGADAVASGTAAELLLACTRRVMLEESTLEIEGDDTLARRWFGHCGLG